MTHEQKFRVASRCELLAFLVSEPVGLSRKQAKDLLRFRAVTVPRLASVRHDTQLEPGDVVTIARRKNPLAVAAPVDLCGLKIVHLDDAVVVVDKPAGLLSIATADERHRTVHRILNDHLRALTKSSSQQAFIVHRLDRETSGLMTLARTPPIQEAIQNAWKNVAKKYLAIVEGAPAEPAGTLRDNLVESKSLKMRRVERGGEEAITHYRVMRTNQVRSLLELTLETGRKNQIRVQLATLGHPIVGDRKYGAATDPARRLGLHSHKLEFCHPVSGAQMEFTSSMPAALAALVPGPAKGRGAGSRDLATFRH